MVSMSKIKNILFGRHLWITNTISGGTLISPVFIVFVVNAPNSDRSSPRHR